jgi:hypothetical protein
MNSRISSIDKISSTQMGAQPKSGNDYFEVSCRSKIDHIEVSFQRRTEMIAGSQSCTCVARRVLILVLPITPSPSTISISFKESKFPSVVISCTESLLWFSIVIT